MAEKQQEDKMDMSGKLPTSKAAASKEDAMMAALKKGKSAAPKQEYIGEYTVVAGDSMGAIAAKYYGSAVEAKWMAIYEANKELIGDNPRMIHPGQVLKIPKLPE